MSKQTNSVTINIDNKLVKVARGTTILQAAEQNDIYIPTLCAHEDLTPYGGCRLCIVEVEGMRNLPTACTTPVEEGMVVRTHTAQVQAVRMDVLQLFMSEHTSSCLICDERVECKKYSTTIRKAGVTTGCRHCPKDGQCELQDVAEYLGATEIRYPVYYRNLRVEKEDPFYDRDYNQCILCGRCVRVCQEIRLANVLAFNQRGRDTVIGPAYGRTHLDAGCEFCGACVAVCPTGALREKTRAWEGEPDREEITTCSFCSVGCQVRLLAKGDRVIGSLPADDPLVNKGQLCVKGRFCITELVEGHQRLKQPYRVHKGTKAEITWDEAVELAAEKISACAPEEFGMLVSPNCTNEDLYVAQKFVRVAVGSHNIDTSARTYYGGGFNAYMNLLRKSLPLSDLQKASTILCIGLDTRFGRSVVGVDLRRAMRRNAKVITVNPRHHALTLNADLWLQPVPGMEGDLVRALVRLTGNKKATTSQAKPRRGSRGLADQVAAAAEMLRTATAPVILVGSEFLQLDDGPRILESIDQLAENIGAGVLPLPAQNNLFGSILMGAYPELLPGGFSSTNKKRISELKKSWATSAPVVSSGWNIDMLSSGKKKIKVLYLVGESPPGQAPRAEFLISQNIYPPDTTEDVDLTLPAAAFTEVDGTFINGEGRTQRVRKVVEPKGRALPDWEILCRIARKMGASGFDYTSAAQIHKEFSRRIPGLGTFGKPTRRPAPLKSKGEFALSKVPRTGKSRTDKKSPFLLSVSITEHTHRGFPLSSWVEGSKQLMTEEVLEMSPDDAKKAKISEGDRVVVTGAGFKETWPARILSDQPQGTLHVSLPEREFIRPNPHPVRIRKKNV